MQSLDAFFTQLLPLVGPNIALPIVREALRSACRDFAKRTHLWTHTNVLHLQTDTTSYAMPIPEDTLVQEILYMGRRIDGTSDPVKYNDISPFRTTESDLDYESTSWRNLTSDTANVQAFYLGEDRKTLHIVPKPLTDYPDGLTFRVALMPDQNAVEVPDIFYDSWAEAIAAGAAAKILMTPGKDFTNYEGALLLQRDFNKAVAAAMRMQHTNRDRVKFRRLGETSGARSRWYSRLR